MLALDGLLVVCAAFAVVAVSPGPANIAVSAVAMRSGRRAAATFGLGLAAGLAFWGLIAATGLGALLETTALALTALKVFGAAYLLWLAFGSARAAIKADQARAQVSQSDGRWFVRGLVLNLSNPKAVFAWMAALSVGLGSNDSLSQLALATVLCAVIGILNYLGYAALFSVTFMRDGYARARRWIEGIVAGLFAFAGLGLLRSALLRAQ